MTSSNGVGPPLGGQPPTLYTGLSDWVTRNTGQRQITAYAELVDPEIEAELAEERAQLARDQAAAQLARARLDLPSDDENKKQQKRVRKLRGMQDDLEVLRITSAINAEKWQHRVKVLLSKVEAISALWKTRAKARRVRLMDPTSRLASIYRAQVLSTLVQMALMLIGITYCAIQVGNALGGHWTMYGVEPLFSIPLLIIMAMHAIAAQNGTVFPAPPPPGGEIVMWHGKPAVYWRLLLIKLALFFVTTTLNVAPVLPGVGHWRDLTTLIAHLFPPALIILVVLLQPAVSAFLSRVLVSINLEIQEADKRLDAEEVRLFDRARAINDAWQRGELTSANPNDPNDRSAGPSVGSVQNLLGIGKAACQAGVDGWHRAYGPRTN